MKTVMKFLLAVTFLATIQAYHLGYYQPHVVYPQFYQTYPAVFARPIMGQPIESHQRNICKNYNGQVVPCYKSFAEKVDQSGIKPVINLFKSMSEKIQENTKLPAFRSPVNPVFHSISEDNEENYLVKAIEANCQEMKDKNTIGVLRKIADLFLEVDNLFGQSEEDLVFRKLTGIDAIFPKDFAKGYRSVVKLIEDTCANPNSEGAVADFLSISAKLEELQMPEVDETVDVGTKVQNYIETVCGWEKSKHIPDIQDVGGDVEDIDASIPIMLKVIQDIQENSKDWKCANRVTKYLNGSIQLAVKMKELTKNSVNL